LLTVEFSSAQQNCKVLTKNISESYTGDCKKGLAHGSGSAKGIDLYKGEFRKGLPHGKGTYNWNEGERYVGDWKKGERFGKGTYTDLQGGKYTGDWKNGMKDGEGTFELKLNDQDSIMAGLWKEDKYLGPKPERSYEIISRRSIDRVTMIRISDGNRFVVKTMQNGMENTTIQNFHFECVSIKI